MPRHIVYLAGTLNNLGTLDAAQNRVEEARQISEEALRIYRQLAKSNLEIYLSDVADSLLNLGSLDVDQNRTVEAHQAYEEALGTYRQLRCRCPGLDP